MQSKQKRLVMLAVLLVASALLISIVASRQYLSNGLTQSALTVVVPASPTTFDSAKLMNVVDHYFVSTIHSPLWLVDGKGQLVHLLGKRVEMNADGMSCRIQIAPARFSDGSKVSAKDVIYSFRRLRGCGHPQAFVFDRIADEPNDFEIVDDLTLVVRFKQPDPDWPQLVANAFCSIIKELSDKLPPQSFDTQVVGAGPYIIEQIAPGDRFTFVRNSGFPHLADFDRLCLRVIGSEQSQITAVAEESADLVQLAGPIIGEAAKFQTDGSHVMRQRFIHADVISQPANELVVLFINHNAPALQKLSVAERRNLYSALYNSLPRDQIAKELYFGRAQPAQGCTPPSTSGSGTVFIPPQATPPNGLPTLGLVAANDADSRRLAEMVRAAANTAGINIEITFVDLATLVERMLAGDNVQLGLIWFEMNISSSGPLPWSLFFAASSPFVVLGQEIDGLKSQVDEARGSLDNRKRAELYNDAFTRINRHQYVWVPFVSRNSTWLKSKRIGDDFLDLNGKLHVSLIRRAGDE